MFSLLLETPPVWAWIVSAIILVIAVVIIVLLILLGKKRGGKSETKTQDSASAGETAAETTAAKPKPAAKTSGKVYHISKRKEDGMWQIKAAGSEKAIKLFRTQKEAIEYCKTLAKNQDASIMIHKEDGSFRKLTY